MTRKLKGLIVLNIILLLTIVGVSNWERHSRTIVAENLPGFALQDSAAVNQLIFGNNVFKKQKGKLWLINDKTPADVLMMEQLLTILQQIDIKRTLTDKSKASISQQIAKEGIAIKFFAADQLQKSFKILGIGNETYAQLPDSEPFVVHTPAHKAVLHEIMGLEEAAWQNRTLLSTGWNSLQNLSLTYPQKPEQSFAITFDSALYKKENQIFYQVRGVNKIDSLLLFNYIQNLNSVRAMRYLDNPALKDSLQKIQPFCIVSLEDLTTKNNNTLKLYANNQTMLAFSERNQAVALVDARYFTSFLLRKKDFEK